MQSDFLMFCLDHVQEDMTTILTHAFPIAKPLLTLLIHTLHYTLWVVNTAIGT